MSATAEDAASEAGSEVHSAAAAAAAGSSSSNRGLPRGKASATERGGPRSNRDWDRRDRPGGRTVVRGAINTFTLRLRLLGFRV